MGSGWTGSTLFEEGMSMKQDTLKTMTQIMDQKDADIARTGQPQLDPETKKLAERKRFTFDVITVPVDPLR